MAVQPVQKGLAVQKTPKARVAYRQVPEADLLYSEAAVRFFIANDITGFPPFGDKFSSAFADVAKAAVIPTTKTVAAISAASEFFLFS